MGSGKDVRSVEDSVLFSSLAGTALSCTKNQQVPSLWHSYARGCTAAYPYDWLSLTAKHPNMVGEKNLANILPPQI